MLRPGLLLWMCAGVYLIVLYFAGFFSWDLMPLGALLLID